MSNKPSTINHPPSPKGYGGTSEPLTIIAIDGPSASGKSTVARGVAKNLGHIYVDSGSLYRGITWKMLKQGISAEDVAGLIQMVDDLDFEFFVNDGALRFRIDGLEPGQELRENAVNESVSPVSAVPAVRKKVVGALKSMTAFGSLVIEGRDIGTAVFPEADYKFYLDASAEERARRRHSEIDKMTVTEVQESLQRRDSIDTTRAMDPLKVADNAEIIDSTSLQADDVIDLILKRVEIS